MENAPRKVDTGEPWTEQEIIKEAERRYLYDAEFHARVELTIWVIALAMEGLGTPLGENKVLKATLTATTGVALVVATLDPTTGRSL